MRQSETSVLIYLHKRSAGTWGTNGTYGTSDQIMHMKHKITFITAYSWNRWYIRNFWNASAGTLGSNGTFGTSE